MLPYINIVFYHILSLLCILYLPFLHSIDFTSIFIHLFTETFPSPTLTSPLLPSPYFISIIISYKVVDLIPGGRNIAVTDETKAEYIRLVAHHRMTAAIRSQVSTCTYSFLHSDVSSYGALSAGACLS